MVKNGLKRLLSAAGLAALGFVSSASDAEAHDPPYAWWGEMVLLTVTPECRNRVEEGDGTTIVFRPKLQAGEPNSALSYLFGHASGIVTKQATTLQFNGSGAATSVFVSGRATLDTTAASFSLSVTPPNVAPTTNFLSFTGSFTNFAGRAGCNVTVRGVATRRL